MPGRDVDIGTVAAHVDWLVFFAIFQYISSTASGTFIHRKTVLVIILFCIPNKMKLSLQLHRRGNLIVSLFIEPYILNLATIMFFMLNSPYLLNHFSPHFIFYTESKARNYNWLQQWKTFWLKCRIRRE